ncbi:hypothetical protein FRX31_021002 [Thalictrum thalictroides]|uniref:Uncharacterized protein n=1 Tax=Thalictrum thalictroides TaxID=46969 RepID=A0A7J6VWC6_THATH|nr:hypothetical protein FRX31_021002 [Thalictrum thalictroides]
MDEFFSVINFCWTEHQSFLAVVSENWAIPMAGDPLHRMMKKLKRLKLVLKEWNRTVFGDVNVSIRVAQEDFDQFQLLADQNTSDEVLAELMRQKEVVLENAISLKASLTKQKSRLKLDVEGDKTLLKIKQGYARISQLEDEEGGYALPLVNEAY